MARTKQTARKVSIILSIFSSPSCSSRSHFCDRAVMHWVGACNLQLHHNKPWPKANCLSPPVARPPVSNLLPRLLASPHHLPEVSRSPTDTSLVPSLSVRSVVTRSPPSSSSESFPSNVSFVRSLRTSSPTSVSRAVQSAPSKSPLRPILSHW